MSPERPTIDVILDTNLLREPGYNFVRRRTKDVITRSNAYTHVRVHWFVPSMVRLERRYQMFKEAAPLLKHAKDFHEIFGAKPLRDDEKALGQKIDRRISKQMNELGIVEIKLRTAQVNWAELMFNSAMRIPPFSAHDQEDSKAEKGFRDAIILETALQYLEEKRGFPDTNVMFVSNDNLLMETLKSKSGSAQLYLFKKIEDLETHLSAIEAQIEEGYGRTVVGIAQESLSDTEGNSSIFRQMKVLSHLVERYNTSLQVGPDPSWSVRTISYRLGSTGLRSKRGSRFTFATQLYLLQEATKEVYVLDTNYSAPPDPFSNSLGGGILGGFNDDDYGPRYSQEPFGAATGRPVLPKGIGILGNYDSFRTRIEKQVGQMQFEFIWQASLVSDTVLEQPSLEAINHVGSEWAPAE